MPTETSVTINIDLNAAIKAAAHQRIDHMESEILRLEEVARTAKASAENLDETISEAMTYPPPPHLAAFLDSVVDIAKASSAQVWWDSSKAADDRFVIVIEAQRTPPRHGIPRSFEFTVAPFDSTDEVHALMDQALVKRDEYTVAHNEAMRLRRILAAPDARGKLEGELLSRFIEQQSPEVAALLASVATDTTTRRLIGVGG